MVAGEGRFYEGVTALESARRARRDALPEHTQYTDTGCDVHPSCLTCPLVRCRYDEPGGARKVFSEDRDRAIVGLQGQGMPVAAIAARFGVSRRTVFRALASARRNRTHHAGAPELQRPAGQREAEHRHRGPTGDVRHSD